MQVHLVVDKSVDGEGDSKERIVNVFASKAQAIEEAQQLMEYYPGSVYTVESHDVIPAN